MASKFLRRQKWWTKFRHPATGETVRASLETSDAAKAELLRERIELHAALLDPRFQAVEIPESLGAILGLAPAPQPVAVAAAVPAVGVMPHPSLLPISPKPRTTVDEAFAAYYRYISAENVALYVANKLSIFRRFFGAERIEKAGAPAKQKRRRKADGGVVADAPPFFTGTYMDEITPVLVQQFIEGADISRKTQRHYREVLHHFFEVCLKLDLYTPTNWHRPNPIAALPSYISKNHRITYLTADDVTTQLAALKCDPSTQMAATIMIHAGLRRAEALWLTKDAIAPDLSFISVRNRVDEETDTESTLKTGERTVTILPPLRKALKPYLRTLKGRWVIPDKLGKRWRPDCFTTHLRKLNDAAGLPWTCLTFRHTYATQRAAESWTLFRISKEMGNSAAMVEQYYAAYIHPGSADKS